MNCSRFRTWCIFIAYFLYIPFVLAMIGGSIYVMLHFVIKYW